MDTAYLSRLEDCLTREIEASEQFLETLHDENSALAGNEPGRLEQVLALKSRLLTDLDAMDRERDRLMRQAGLGPEEEDVETWIAQSNTAGQAPLLRNWRRLLEIAERCRAQNAVNGALIQSGLRHMQEVLAVLRGQTPADQPVNYGPPGHTPRSPGGQALGQA